MLTIEIERACQLSKHNPYEITIVGGGLGGGVLARKLIENGKRVLLIEKGGLTFSTHCLNTSHSFAQIDVIYNAVKGCIQTTPDSDAYVGGPVYCLGGRSNLWGLHVVRIDEHKYKQYFPQAISNNLEKNYQDAFNLMTNSSQSDLYLYPTGYVDEQASDHAKQCLNRAICEFSEHQGVQNSSSVPKARFASIAAEFRCARAYQFPQGAYSTVDFLLDRMYAKDTLLTTILHAEVLQFEIERTTNSVVLAVRSTHDKTIHQLHSKNVILCSGSIGTASIALNSGLQISLPLVGKGLTDHEIWRVQFLKKSLNSSGDPLKFETNLNINGEEVLLNVSATPNIMPKYEDHALQIFDSDGELLNSDLMAGDLYNSINITIEYEAKLMNENEVLNVPASEPLIRIKRQVGHSRRYKAKHAAMKHLVTLIRNELWNIRRDIEAPELSLLGFGKYAHEVGTMRIRTPETNSAKDYVVNDDLQLSGYDNLYVCDLSIFPWSPSVNPSLTLAALAIHLANALIEQNR